MVRPRIFVTQPIAESALARLREVADVEVNPDSSRVLDKEKLVEAVKRCDILLSLLHDTVDADVLAANPQLKAVSSMNITQDRIDLAEATRRGIPVTNIPAIVTDATADIGFGLLLAVARNIALGDKLFRSGVYPGSQSNHLAGAAVTGRTLGLVGFGRIGQAMARRGRGFDMNIIYADPRRLPPEEEEEICRRLSQLRRSSARGRFRLAAPATLTRNQASDERPAVRADEADSFRHQYLARAGDRRGRSGARAQRKEDRGRRPRRVRARAAVSSELMAMPNVVLTPHLGSAVAALREGMAHVVVDNTIALIEGKPPVSCLNPEVLKKQF